MMRSSRLAAVALVFLAGACTDRLVKRERQGKLEIPSICTDFSAVQLGTRVARSIPVRNVGEGPLRIERAQLSEEGFFEVRTELPLLLPPDDPATDEDEGLAELVVVYAPIGIAAPHQAKLHLQTDVDKGAEHCLLGEGSGPVLSCPPKVDLGTTGVGLAAEREIVCTNHAAGGATMPQNEATVTAIRTLNENFTVSASSSDGGPAENIPVGGTVHLKVRFVPLEAGQHEGEALLVVDGLDETLYPIQLSGRAIPLRPCELEVGPDPLDFGHVPSGLSSRRNLTIRNGGEESCHLWDLKLEEGSDPAYNVAALEETLLEPGEKLVVGVTFRPEEQQFAHEGALVFTASDSERPHRRVPLAGRSRKYCAVLSAPGLDFGEAEPGCSSAERPLRLINVCDHPIEVEEIAVEGPALASFALRGLPRLPAKLESFDALQFGVAYAPPGEPGTHDAWLAISLDIGDQQLSMPLHGEATSGARVELHHEQRLHTRVDVLWVIDNSASMQAYQRAVADGLTPFLADSVQRGSDFQIGVTTTSLERSNGSLGCPGGVEGGEDGRLFPVDHSHPRILRSDTPDLEEHWKHNLSVGLCSGNEMGLEAAWRALSTPVIDSKDDPRHPESEDGNLGLLRPEAALAIVFLSDERDQSPENTARYFDRLSTVKGAAHPEKLSIHAIVGDPETGCSSGTASARPGDRYVDLVERSGGSWASICSSDWSASLRLIGDGVFGRRSRFVLDNACADGGADLEVKVNDTPVPRFDGPVPRWTWDAERREVRFSPGYVPPVGSSIHISCTPICI